jgi:hypothetical protein
LHLAAHDKAEQSRILARDVALADLLKGLASGLREHLAA